MVVFTVLARALILAINRAGYDPVRWLAEMIVTSASAEIIEAVAWGSAGILGLIGLVTWEWFRLGNTIAGWLPQAKVALDNDANQLLISADDIIPAESNGCSALEFVTLPGSGARSAFVAFDTAAQEHGGWSMDLPPEWEHHKVRFRLRWSHPKVTQGNASGVAFKIFGPVATTRSFAVSVKITDFGGAPDTLHLSPWSDPSQPISFDIDNHQVFEIVRDVGAKEDTSLEDARIHAVLIERLGKQ